MFPILYAKNLGWKKFPNSVVSASASLEVHMVERSSGISHNSIVQEYQCQIRVMNIRIDHVIA